MIVVPEFFQSSAARCWKWFLLSFPQVFLQCFQWKFRGNNYSLFSNQNCSVRCSEVPYLTILVWSYDKNKQTTKKSFEVDWIWAGLEVSTQQNQKRKVIYLKSFHINKPQGRQRSTIINENYTIWVLVSALDKTGLDLHTFT